MASHGDFGLGGVGGHVYQIAEDLAGLSVMVTAHRLEDPNRPHPQGPLTISAPSRSPTAVVGEATSALCTRGKCLAVFPFPVTRQEL